MSRNLLGGAVTGSMNRGISFFSRPRGLWPKDDSAAESLAIYGKDGSRSPEAKGRDRAVLRCHQPLNRYGGLQTGPVKQAFLGGVGLAPARRPEPAAPYHLTSSVLIQSVMGACRPVGTFLSPIATSLTLAR